MRQHHCSHKGMGAGICCWVGHFRVCKKFFQVLFLLTSVHHLVVLLGNLLPHLSVLVCCLDPGHCHLDPGHNLNCQRKMIGSGTLVWWVFMMNCSVLRWLYCKV